MQRRFYLVITTCSYYTSRVQSWCQHNTFTRIVDENESAIQSTPHGINTLTYVTLNTYSYNIHVRLTRIAIIFKLCNHKSGHSHLHFIVHRNVPICCSCCTFYCAVSSMHVDDCWLFYKYDDNLSGCIYQLSVLE